MKETREKNDVSKVRGGRMNTYVGLRGVWVGGGQSRLWGSISELTDS